MNPDHASVRGWPVLAGLAVLLLPTYTSLAQTLWKSDEHSFAPLIGLITLWLLWQDRRNIFRERFPDSADQVAGGVLFVIGLISHVIGRSQNVPQFEMVAQIMLLSALLLLLRGRQALRNAWFPLAFLSFMIPLPGIWIDAMTTPLKLGISVVADELLYGMALPVARSGVIISIGAYQMLVADACSGLNSLLSMSALGVLFVYLSRVRSPMHVALLLGSILPVIFVTNLFRVVLLILVTYFLGAGAGQMLHDVSSPLVFALGLLMLIGTNKLITITLSGRLPCLSYVTSQS
jgi:exosortase B